MIAGQSPPFADVDDWDDSLESGEDAKLIVAEAWALLDDWLRENAESRVLTVEMTRRWHKMLFEGVFPQFAGRVRNRLFPKEVSFGDYYGVGSNYVDRELEEYERNVHVSMKRLEEYVPRSQHDFAVQAVRVAAWCHADFVRIHPFINGNGRTGRLIVDYFAYRYGLEPLGFPRPSTRAYISAMSHYMRHHDSGELAH